jgi:hypothetical protein
VLQALTARHFITIAALQYRKCTIYGRARRFAVSKQLSLSAAFAVFAMAAFALSATPLPTRAGASEAAAPALAHAPALEVSLNGL